MLTLTNPITIEGFSVYQDDGNAGSSEARRFYVLPNDPTIAKDDDDNPIFSLIVYRHAEERIAPGETADDVGGGILTFTVELAVPEDKLRRIRNRLRTMVFGDDAEDPSNDVDLSYVQFENGTVTVAVAGETGTDTGEHEREFVENAVGTGKVSGIGANSKAVMVKLTQAGAALMSQLQELRTLPINVQYNLSFEHRLLGVTMNVWCDINSSYSLIQEVIHQNRDEWGGYLSMSRDRSHIDKVTSVTETLVRNKTAGVVVKPATSEVDAETLMSLEKFGFEMLNKEMKDAVQASPPPAELDRTYLESFTQNYNNNFNFTLDRHMVLVREYNPSANISNVFQEGNFDEMVAFIDLGITFFKFLKVPIRVNCDFSKLPLDSVTITITYQREPVGGGGREEAVDSFNFTDGAIIQTFLAYANRAMDVTYDWSATVHYKGSHENYTFNQNNVKDDFLVVDVGKLGMLRVDLGLGLVDLDDFPTAKVSMRYHSTALGRTLEDSFVLNKDALSTAWTAVIHEEPSAYEYKVDWLRSDDEILESPWISTTSTRLRLNAPTSDKLKVQVICSGNFKNPPNNISQVAVSLLYEDPDNNYTEESALVFTDDKQQQLWEIPLRNKEIRDYRYRFTINYSDGMSKKVPDDGSWLVGEPGFITVGEKYTLEVDIYPTLLTYPDHARLVQVDLQYDDDAGDIHSSNSYVFTKDSNANQIWRVSGKPGGPQNYTYIIKYFSATGEIISLEPVTQEANALVIPPPLSAIETPTPPSG